MSAVICPTCWRPFDRSAPSRASRRSASKQARRPTALACEPAHCVSLSFVPILGRELQAQDVGRRVERLDGGQERREQDLGGRVRVTHESADAPLPGLGNPKGRGPARREGKLILNSSASTLKSPCPDRRCSRALSQTWSVPRPAINVRRSASLMNIFVLPCARSPSRRCRLRSEAPLCPSSWGEHGRRGPFDVEGPEIPGFAGVPFRAGEHRSCSLGLDLGVRRRAARGEQDDGQHARDGAQHCQKFHRGCPRSRHQRPPRSRAHSPSSRSRAITPRPAPRRSRTHSAH